MELGVTGKSQPLYGLKLSMRIPNDVQEHIQYRGLFTTAGWSSWTTGGNKLQKMYRMLAVNIQLTGTVANYYDVYYYMQENVITEFAKNNITIPYPHVVIKSDK